MRELSTVILLLILCAACLAAQDQQSDKKNELSGSVGRTLVSNQSAPAPGLANPTVYFGHGVSFAGNYARRIRDFHWADLAIEVPINVNPGEDLDYGANEIPRDYKSILVTPAARLRLIPGFAISPWVSCGGGVGHFQSSRDLILYGINTGHRVKTAGVLQGGVGMDVRIPWKFHSWKFRLEARDDWSGVPAINIDTGKTRQHNHYVGGGSYTASELDVGCGVSVPVPRCLTAG